MALFTHIEKIKLKEAKYGIFRRTEVIFGKVIKNSELGFTNGGTQEYKAAADKIFKELTSYGNYSSLPAPSDKKKKRK